MVDTTLPKTWQRIGSLFQIPMMLIFGCQLCLFYIKPTRLWILQFIGYAGAVLFVWCLWRLYIRRARLTGLITTGPFRLTRHPMYFGLLLMNIFLWIRVPGVWSSASFLLLEVLFLALMFAAGYCQEKETLMRFGDAAVMYYKRTPRLPLTAW